ncbi:MAG TPA: phosphoglycerate kinase [Candidatus Paceibacterota bacterium]|nr:phosphoglycerate kinase [Candidatus Paceibacterota bacterium]
MRSVRNIPHLENAPVLVRAALNVPIADGKVANTFRLRQALPTIEYLQKKHARVILIGHIGDKGTETLLPVAQALREFIPRLSFCPYTTGAQARAAVRALVPGEVLMLENLRRHAGEKANDPEFVADLAELADVFVQDSFDVCHRKHASVIGVPELLPSYAGLLLETEVKELKKALTPKRPSLAVIGGAKFSTKEPVIKTLLERYDRVFVGGALSNDFLRAKGYPLEASLVSETDHDAIKKLLTHPRLVIPSDEIYAVPGAPVSESKEGMLDGKAPFEAVLDNGPRTLAQLESMVQSAKTILWNGPLGNYERGYVAGTERLAKAIAKSGAYSILGGGDTIAAVEKLGLSGRFSFISTGGGAMLDFIATGTLPGIDALS